MTDRFDEKDSGRDLRARVVSVLAVFGQGLPTLDFPYSTFGQ